MTIDPSSPSVSIDRQQFEEQHALIWGVHKWPEGTLLSVCHMPANHANGTKGAFATTGHAPVTSPEGIWALIERNASKGANTYISVAGMSPELGARDKGKRGGKADVVGLPALVADLDVRGGAHSANNLPTEAEALEWIAAMPLPATAVVRTGGGFHVWLTLDSLLDPSTEEGMRCLETWKSWFVDRAAKSGRHIDAGVLADPARVLRPAGTVNAKETPLPVTLLTTDKSAVHPLADVVAAFSLPDTPPSTAIVVATDPTAPPTVATSATSSPTVSASDGAGEERIGTRFARELGAGEFAIAAFSARRLGNDSLIFPRRDGSYASDSNAQIYPSNMHGPERVVIFGERVKAECAELGVSEPYAGTSWELLARFVCRGDFKLAAKLLHLYSKETDGWRALLTAVTTLSIDELRNATATPTPAIRDAVASNEIITIPLGDGDVVTINGPHHGLAFHKKNKDGEVTVFNMVDWVAWTSKVVESYAVTSTGQRVQSGEALYSIDLVRRDGKRFRGNDLTASEAHNPTIITDRVNSGVKLPTGSVDRRRVENMLRALGRDDSQETTDQFTSAGWLVEKGKPAVFLAPAGSISAAGVTDAFDVIEPAGSQAGGLQPAQRAMGWDTIPTTRQELIAAASAIDAFLRIAPRRRDLGIAILGALFAAPLALSTRTTLIIFAKPGIGKSQIASAAQAFYSAVGVDGRSFSMNMKGSSPVGAELVSSWSRHLPAIYDDFRFSGIRAADEKMANAVNTVIQANYGADGASKGTQAGGMRAARTADGLGILTAETMPTSEAIVSRSIGIELRDGDVKLLPKRESVFDDFVKNFANTGLARSMQAHYLRYLAARIDELGDLTAFRRANDDRKMSWLNERGGRTTETASVLAAGWMVLRDWAIANEIEHLLPTTTEIDEVLSTIADVNEAATAEANPAVQIIEKARDMLHGGTGYLLPHDMVEPSKDPAKYGWEYQAHAYEPHWSFGNKRKLGLASRDGQYIALTAEAVRYLQTALGLSSLTKGQILRGFETIVRPGTKPGDQISAELGIDGRPRAYVVSANLFDVDLPSFAPSSAPELNVPALATNASELNPDDGEQQAHFAALQSEEDSFRDELVEAFQALGHLVTDDFFTQKQSSFHKLLLSQFGAHDSAHLLMPDLLDWEERRDFF